MSYRITDGRLHGYRIGDLYDDSSEVGEITGAVNSRMFSQIRDHEMSLSVSCVLALQGAGKTEFCKYLAYMASLSYGSDLKILLVDNPSISYLELDDHPVHMVIVDDAATYLSSQSGAKNRDEYNKWFMIRHTAEKAADSDTGRLIYLFNWQRYSTVHPNFRNPNMWFFASPMADRNDIDQVRQRTGDVAYDALKANWDRILSGDQSRKSQIMARIPDREIPSGVGWYMSEYMREYAPEWSGWPKLIRSEEYFGKKKEITREDVLEKLRSDTEWERDLSVAEFAWSGKPQKDIASEYGISQPMVSKIVRKTETQIEEMMRM